MRVVLVGVLSCMLIGCGRSSVRHSTEESNHNKAVASQSVAGPFHSLTGWIEKVVFYLDDTAPDQVVEAAQNAAESWNEGIGHEVLVFGGVARVPRGDHLYSSLDDTITLVYYEKNWTSSTGKAETTLATTIWENAADSDRIVKGDVILNAQVYNFCDALSQDLDHSNSNSVVDAETVLLHEFGHLLGLDHVDYEIDPDSVMHAKTYIGPYMSLRSLSEGDLGHVLSIYD
ncbi:MAG: matrixin family metalloprotease [Proteobacteria bacterium]|nr:matrixin family metalloprotease [Pseudomonadota bacterium]